MRRTSYEDILQKLDYALAFGASIGLERIAQRGRFADYRRRIAHLIEVRGMRPFPQDVVAHLAEYLTALTESMELGDLLPYLQQCDRACVSPKLRECLQGPFLPSAIEDKSRNIQFELFLASTLWRADFPPLLGEHPDLRCEVDGTRFFFECKRLLSSSPAALKKRIHEASRQLYTHRHTALPRTRGIVAVSLSRVLNPTQEPLPSQNEQSERQALAAWLASQADSVSDELGKLSQKKVAAILFHVASPFESSELEYFSFGRYFRVHRLLPAASPACNSVLRLAEAIEGIRY
jgi:hypothetical protein